MQPQQPPQLEDKPNTLEVVANWLLFFFLIFGGMFGYCYFE